MNKNHINLTSNVPFEDLPKWFRDAKTENAIVNYENNALKWRDGTWHDGIWHDGIWKDGIWYYGTWLDGTWKGGTWLGGTWRDGIKKDEKK